MQNVLEIVVLGESAARNITHLLTSKSAQEEKSVELPISLRGGWSRFKPRRNLHWHLIAANSVGLELAFNLQPAESALLSHS